jgi:hypothetical protein
MFYADAAVVEAVALADVETLLLATERALFVVRTGPDAILAPILALGRRNLLYHRHLYTQERTRIRLCEIDSSTVEIGC